MMGRRNESRFPRRLAAGAVLALGTLALVSTAEAQSAEDLLKKLKPWIEQRFFGATPPTEEPAEDAGAADNPETASPSVVPEPAEGAGDEPGADSAAAEAPQSDDGSTPGTSEWPVGLAEPGPPTADDTASTGSTEPPDESAAESAESMEPPEPIDQGPPPLRFAMLAGSSASVTMATVGPIADEIGGMIDRPVELLAMVSYDAMIEAQVGQRIDGGFYSASAFALADARCDCLEPIVAPRAFDGTLAYHAIIVARAGSGIASVADLKGKTVAVGAADSLGARRMQLAGLMASGVNAAETFGGVLEVGSAAEAVRMVRDRVADAAFAWSSMSGDVGHGYSRGTLSELVADGELVMDDIVIVWRSPPITHGPFAVLKTLSEEEKDKIAAFFVTLEATRPGAYERLNPFYGGGYAPVDAADYGGLESLMAQNVDALALPTKEVPAPILESTPPEAD